MQSKLIAFAVERVREEIDNFEKLQRKYEKHGASDTEPDGIFQLMLWNIRQDKKKPIPTDWDLYDSSMDCSKANVALTEQAHKVASALLATVDFGNRNYLIAKDIKEVREFLDEYCWRM